MYEGSRQQTGCFLATLMALAAAFMLRTFLRAFWMGGDAASIPDRTQIAFVVGLAACIVVLAIFALKLRVWALVAYALLSLFGIAYSMHYELGVAIPLVIGLCTVSAISFVQRDLFE